MFSRLFGIHSQSHEALSRAFVGCGCPLFMNFCSTFLPRFRCCRLQIRFKPLPKLRPFSSAQPPRQASVQINEFCIHVHTNARRGKPLTKQFTPKPAQFRNLITRDSTLNGIWAHYSECAVEAVQEARRN